MKDKVLFVWLAILTAFIFWCAVEIRSFQVRFDLENRFNVMAQEVVKNFSNKAKADQAKIQNLVESLKREIAERLEVVPGHV